MAKKIVYSLVLSSDVVAAVDQVAYGKHTSRSNLINQILAEYVNLLTPEKRIEEIFTHAQGVFGQHTHFQLVMQPSDFMMTIKSALPYRYNPAVRYSIELYPEGEQYGELRISLRSQNAGLLHHLKQFFQIWVRIEEAYGTRTPHAIENGRFSRKLTIPPRLEDDYLRQGTVLAAFIRTLDGSMKGYFSNLHDRAAGVREIERHYIDYLKECKESI